jgi:hypothetical protein
MVPEASGKLSEVLGSPKNVVNEKAKTGIYEKQCQTCLAVYTIERRGGGLKNGSRSNAICKN